MFTIAHLSDLHIGGRPESVDRARKVITHIAAMRPLADVLLVTGDIADHGADEEYVTAREMLSAWPGPVLVGTGNHDAREPFARGSWTTTARGRSTRRCRSKVTASSCSTPSSPPSPACVRTTGCSNP